MMLPLKKFKFALPYLGLFSLFFLLLQPVLGQQSSRESLNLKHLKTVQAEILMSAGTLKLSTHDAATADLNFLYSRAIWKPEINLDQQSKQAMLSIRQPEGKNFNMKENERNDWHITLPNKLEGDLKIRIGAGEGTVDLQGAKVQRLELIAGAGDFNVNLANTALSHLDISAGVGSLSLDLSGKRSNNLTADINGGIGDLNLLLPARTGVRVKINGLGSVDNAGFTKQDGYYVNEAYGKTDYSVDITVNGGLGSVALALDH